MGKVVTSPAPPSGMVTLIALRRRFRQLMEHPPQPLEITPGLVAQMLEDMEAALAYAGMFELVHMEILQEHGVKFQIREREDGVKMDLQVWDKSGAPVFTARAPRLMDLVKLAMRELYGK